MMVRRLGMILLVMAAGLTLAGMAGAQAGSGQFCVRAFEDRNANGQIDPGEALLTRGVSANLHDERGYVIASAILDNSPTSAQGVMCFENLRSGQYRISVTSAEYTSTGPESMAVIVTEGGLPTIFMYGAQRAFSTDGAAVTPADEDSNDKRMERLLIALIGGLITMFVVTAIGVILYFAIVRRRPRRAPVSVQPYEQYMRPQQPPGDYPYDQSS